MAVATPPSSLVERPGALPASVPAAAGPGAAPRIRVLMIGWEFPPFVAGGLGVACEGLVGGLRERGADIVLLLPGRRPPRGKRRPSTSSAAGSRGLRIVSVGTPLRPYEETGGLYGEQLLDEVSRLASVARIVAAEERFDVIHAHDWMTFPAAVAARDASGRPFVAHVHATEYARSAGGAGDPVVSRLEGEGLRRADRVICVSSVTAGNVRRRYRVPESRIRVVHNAIDGSAADERPAPAAPPLVLFVGRLTRQKGPGRFLEAARRVLDERPEVRFAVAGAGERLPWLRRRAAELGLAGKLSFLGFVPPERLPALYRRASLYVLPSVTEPFGLTVLEAMRQGVPTIAAREAGVHEVVHSAIPVDAADIEELARQILLVLASPSLQADLSRRGRAEVAGLTWLAPAEQCLEIYRELM